MGNQFAEACAAAGLTICGFLIGPYWGIGMGAAAGAYWTLIRSGLTFGKGVAWMIGAIALSATFTSLIANFIAGYFNKPVEMFFAPVAFILSWKGEAILNFGWKEGLKELKGWLRGTKA